LAFIVLAYSLPVEVKLVEDLGGYVRLVGATPSSREHVDQLIPRDELAQLQITLVEANFTAPPREVFLGLEARRYHFASLGVHLGVDHPLPEPGLRCVNPPDAPVLAGEEGEEEGDAIFSDPKGFQNP